MSSAGNLKTEIEELERIFKSTKRRYRRSILKAKIVIKRFVYVRAGLRGRVEDVRVGLHDRVEDAVHSNIERIHKPGFRSEESLTKIYSMIDKTSYILKVKPSKIIMAKYYLSRILSGLINSLTRFKTFLISRLSPPPILYSKSYPLSMIEIRFWYTGVYQGLARKPKGFKDAFIRWKSSLGNYNVKIENFIRRNKNSTKRFFD
jgi:hypothetical protein